MSVLDYASGALFVMRTVKYLSTNPDNEWANSYEFRATAAGDDVALVNLSTAVVLFEQALHLTVVKFKSVLISTWGEDSVPYNPDVFMSLPQTASGTITDTTNMLGLNNTLSIARVPPSGRYGHLFYRGCIQENQVTAPAGKTKLDDPSAMQTTIDAALASSELEIYIGAAVEAPLEMVMIDKAGVNIRHVVGLVVRGMSQVPLDHAWFNRTPPTP